MLMISLSVPTGLRKTWSYIPDSQKNLKYHESLSKIHPRYTSLLRPTCPPHAKFLGVMLAVRRHVNSLPVPVNGGRGCA